MKTKLVLASLITIATLTVSLTLPVNEQPANDKSHLDGKVTKRFGVYVDITGDHSDNVVEWPAQGHHVTICLKKVTKKSRGKKKDETPPEYVPICKGVVHTIDEAANNIEIKLMGNFEKEAEKKGFPDAQLKKDVEVRLEWTH